MNYIFFLLGLLLYVGVVWDIFKTTLSMQGGGWFTSRFGHTFWKVLLKLSGNNGNSKLLSRAGLYLLILIICLWVSGLLLSLFFLFLSQPDSVIDSGTRLPAGMWEKLYYSGFVLSTSGIGDYIASNNFWRIITDLYSFTGLILITMSVTYFVPVLSAIIQKRVLGINLSSLGPTPRDIIENEWNGENFNSLTNKMQALSSDILKYNQNHRAYPVIHFFHNSKKQDSIILQLAKLNETVCIIMYCLKSSEAKSSQAIADVRSALDNYILIIQEVSHIKIDDNREAKKLEVPQMNGKSYCDGTCKIPEQQQIGRLFFEKLIMEDGWKWSDLKEV